jgi:hypothetical protein
VRSPAGLVAAAALVVLGGVSAFLTTGDAVRPWGGLTSVVSHWSGGHSPAASRHDQLAAKLEVARALLSRGRSTEVASILDDVRARLPELPPGERTDLLSGIEVLQGQLGATVTTGVSVSDRVDGVSSSARVGRVPSAAAGATSGLVPETDLEPDGDGDDDRSDPRRSDSDGSDSGGSDSGGSDSGGSAEPSRRVRHAPSPGLVQGTTASPFTSTGAPTSDVPTLTSRTIEPLPVAPPSVAGLTTDATTTATPGAVATTSDAMATGDLSPAVPASAERPLGAG